MEPLPETTRVKREEKETQELYENLPPFEKELGQVLAETWGILFLGLKADEARKWSETPPKIKLKWCLIIIEVLKTINKKEIEH